MIDDPNKTAEAGNGAEEAAEPQAAAPGEAQADRALLLEAEAAEFKDKLLRTLAEMENLRRRTEREVRDARQYAIAGFARDMLVVTDNLRRALDAIGPEAREKGDQTFTTLIEGIDLTERSMLAALEKHGVTRLAPQGQKFDPNLHQAMFELPDPSVPNGTVVQVVQDGYAIGERVLRPALVGVSKGGPKAAPAPEADIAAGPADAEPGAEIDKKA